MVGNRAKRIFLFFLVVFFGFCTVFAAQKIVSYDDWWHLKTGEWIWQNKAVPHIDPFSYTFHGAEWIDFEWLFQAVIYPIYRLGGFEGLIIFKIVIVLMSFIVLFLTCRMVDKGEGWLTVTILFIALLVARGRFMVRPQIISLFFLALYLYFLALHSSERITTRQLLTFLLPLHILWVNFHGGFLMGIVVTGAYAFGRFVPLALRHHQDLTPVFKDKKLQGLLFVCLLLCVASFANPYTYRVFLVPFRTAGSETLKNIAEWVPTTDIRFLSVLVIEPTMWFRVFFLLGAISFLINRKNLAKIENLVLFSFFSFLAFKHIRFCGDFAIVAAPIILNNLRQLRWHVREQWRWLRFLPLLIIIAFSINDVRPLITAERLGLGVGRQYPEMTVNFLKEHEVKGRIFNTYGFGGYIIWHLWPDIPVFIDGRTPTIYDEDFLWFYAMASLNKEMWGKIVKRYGIEIVLVQDDREKGYTTLFYWLDEDDDWRLVAFDDVSNLYMKKGTKFDGLIEKYGFRYLRPSDVSMSYAKEKKGDEKYLKSLEEELNEACQRFPRDFYAFYYLGVYHQIYGTKEHFLAAEKALRRAVENRSDSPRGYYELGFTLMKLERYNEATEAFKRSISLSSNLPADTYYYLGTSYLHQGEIDKAITFLEKYKEKAKFGTRVEAYQFLGRVYLQRYKFRKALSCFEREGYLGKATWETFFSMGLAYFGLDNLEQAKESFERAMEMNPEEIKVIYNLAITYEKLKIVKRADDLFRRVAEMEPNTPEEKDLLERAKNRLQSDITD